MQLRTATRPAASLEPNLQRRPLTKSGLKNSFSLDFLCTIEDTVLLVALVSLMTKSRGTNCEKLINYKNSHRLAF